MLCDSTKPNETEQSVEVFFKQLRVDNEKCDMFKTFIQVTMKDHK